MTIAIIGIDIIGEIITKSHTGYLFLKLMIFRVLFIFFSVGCDFFFLLKVLSPNPKLK